MAVRRLPAPVGIGTSGFGFFGAGTSKTPFAVSYPGTTGMHTHLQFRAVVIEAVGDDGAGDVVSRLIMMRADTIGVSAVIRQAIVRRLEERFGLEVDQQFVLTATHTHAGPGRLIDKKLWNLIQDDFFPEFFERLVDAAVETVLAAADDLEPARIGHSVGESSRINSDRRCQNAENEWNDVHMLRIDKDDGVPKALVVMLPVHPVVLNIKALVLSQDVSGGIEAMMAEGFESPVTVLHFNGAAADVGKAGRSGEEAAGAAPWPGGFEHIESIGRAAAEDLLPTALAIETSPSGRLDVRTVRTRFDGDAIGYEPGEFPYEFGAVYCTSAKAERCFGDEPPGDLLAGCIDFALGGEESAPADRAPLTLARVGELLLVSTPGEFGVELGREIQAAAREATGVQDVAILGYANEYTGYSLKEEDWWMGGYEASGSLWGPKQGDFLAGAIQSFIRSWAEDRTADAPFPDPGAVAPPPDYEYEPRTPTPSVEVGSISEPAGKVPVGQLVEWTFGGGDPWLGVPLVHVEQHLGGDSFEPVVTAAGARWTSDGYALTMELDPEPAYTVLAVAARTFRWTVRMPVGRRYGGGPPLTKGATYRLVASAPYHDDAGSPKTLEIASDSFTITAD